MSRLTGNDVRGLMEAYHAVYAPQELTEEQVWEEVENWVNALVEEGYDLSEYTWEEMYESYITEAIPLAIPAAAGMARLAIPAAAAAAAPYVFAGVKGFQGWLKQRQKAQENTPGEERFLNTGSFASSKETPAEKRGREASELNRKQNQPAKPVQPVQPSNTTVSAGTIKGEKPRVRITATRPQGSTTSTPGASAQQPKPPEKPPESTAKDLGGEITRQSTTPGQSSSSTGSGGGDTKPPGFGELLRQKLNAQSVQKKLERQARRNQPNPIAQAATDKVADLTARAIERTSGALKNLALGAGAVGLAGVADQTLGGGIVGKILGDVTNLTRQAGPTYERIKDEPPKINLNLPKPKEEEKKKNGNNLPAAGTPPPLKFKEDYNSLIINYLINEKYAQDNKSALKIMENMSQKWIENILNNHF